MSNFTGSSDDDTIKGTKGGDLIDVSQGGDDVVRAGAGLDTINIGGALTAADQIDGGDGSDFLTLEGDYSARLVFGARTIQNIEGLTLGAGHDYNLRLNDANVSTGQRLGVTAGVDSAHKFIFDGSRETDGGYDIALAGEHATVTGGAGDDKIDLDAAVHAADEFDGGLGFDELDIEGVAGTNFRFDASLRNVELVRLNDASFKMTLGDDVVAAHQNLEVNGLLAARVTLDASAETDGTYFVLGTTAADAMIGGAGADTLQSGFGSDVIDGGGGADVIEAGYDADTVTGGTGADDIALGVNGVTGSRGGNTLVYLGVDDSKPRAPDLVSDLINTDRIDLSAIDADSKTAGNQAFHLVSSFTRHTGELMLVFDSDTGVTSLEGDVNGNGKADFVVELSGDHHDFTSFVL